MKNQIKKVLSVVLVLAMCLSTFVIGVSAETCVHDGKSAGQTFIETRDPTCTQMGGDMYRCETCGEKYAVNTKAPLTHDVAEWTVVPVTCTTDGYTYGYCTRENCPVVDKKIVKDEVKAEGHKYPTTPGETCEEKVCTVCGEAVDSETSHNWWIADEEHVKAPTCTEPGEITYKCEDCNVTKTVTIKPLGHNPTVKHEAVPATVCGGTATIEYYTCANDGCDLYFNAAGEEISKDSLTSVVEHLAKVQVGDPIIDELNCTKTTNYYCSACDTKETDVVAHHTPIDHKTDATCTTWGYVYHLCKYCGVETDETDRIAPTGHSFQEKIGETEDGKPIFGIKADAVVAGKIAATCTYPGYLVYTCTKGCTSKHPNGTDTVNGVIFVDPDAPQLDHDWTVLEEAVTGCEVMNKTAKKQCNDCGLIVGGEELGTPEHDFEYGKVYAATCKVDGYTCDECKKCGFQDNIVWSTTDLKGNEEHHHNWKKVVDVEETCTNNGHYTRFCTICMVPDTQDYVIDEIEDGHDMVWKYNVEKATCMTGALDWYECSKCGEGQAVAGTTLDTSAEGHIRHLGDAFETMTYTVERAGTCEDRELRRYICTCNNVNKAFYVQGDYGHTIIDKSETEKVDCFKESVGYTGKWCTTCEAWITSVAQGGAEKVEIKHELDATMIANPFVCKAEGAVAGWKEFKYCSKCATKYENTIDVDTTGMTAEVAAVVTNKYLAALAAAEETKDYHEYTKVDAQAPTCGVAGWYEYCSVCQKATDTDVARTALTHDYTEMRDETADKWGSYTETAADCTEISYKYYICKHCGDEYIDTYVKAPGHTWVEGATHNATCTEDGWVDYECSVCGETKKDYTDELKAKGHFNGTEYFTSACTDPATNRVCEICGPIAKEHSYTDRTYVEPTCVEFGHFISICDFCGEKTLEKPTKEEIDLGYKYDKLGHSWSKIDTITLPTATTKGEDLYKCSVCGVEEKREVAALGLATMDITADSGILAGANIVNGGLVEFTIKLDVADLDAAVLKAEFIYMAEHLEFVSAEVENIFDVKDEAGETVIATTVNKGVEIVSGLGHLTIIVDASYTANKIPTDVELNGEFVFATLTFRVSETMYEDDGDAVVCGLMGAVTSIANVAGKEFIEEDAIAVETVEFAVNKLGSVNADKAINAIDYLAIRQMAITNMNGTVEDGEYALDGVEVNYLAEADIDMDGDIDMDDYVLLVNYLVAPTGNYEKMVLTSQTVVTE